MKFRVFGEVENEPEVFFRLRKVGNDIDLVACDVDGKVVDGGVILSITEKGIVFVYTGLSESLGFPLKNGHMQVEYV